MIAQALSFQLPGGLATELAASLLDAEVRSGCLLLLAVAAAAALRKSSAATRHAIWMATITCALVVPILSLCLPQWRVLPTWMGPELAQNAIAAPGVPPAALFPPIGIQRASAPLTEPVVAPVPLPIASESRNAAVDSNSPAASRAELSRSMIVLLGWASGVVLLLLQMLHSAISLRGLARRSRVIDDGILAETVTEVARELRLSGRVTVHTGSTEAMPMVWGVWRAHLLLPSSAEQWPRTRLRAVLLHELAHILRRDPMTILVAHLSRALHWINPLAWLAVHRLRVEQERACDDYVLRAGVRPSDYATDVLEIAAALRVAPATASIALSMAVPTRLENRLRTIMDEASNRTVLAGWVLTATSMAAVALALPLALVRAADENPKLAIEQIDAASASTSKKPSAFGPVLECTIYDVNGSHPDDSFIDLDAGKLFSESDLEPMSREGDLVRQIGRAKIDLMGDASGQTFRAFDMVVLSIDEKFDSVTAERVDKLLVGSVLTQKAEEVRIPKELPATYLFKTWEGGRGVLEVVRYNNDYESMDVRYRLVQADGVGLHPARPARSNYNFDRDFEREMRSEETRYLDLDTGEFVEKHPPGDLVWLLIESDLRARAGLNMAAVAVEPERWDAKPDDVVRELTNATPQMQVRLAGSEKAKRTWFFKTREGGRGVLQVLPHDKRPGSVLVRYKMVRPRREFEPAVITILPSAGGRRFLSLEDRQLHIEKPSDHAIAYLERDPKVGWSFIVENIYNYPTEREKGVMLGDSTSAEDVAQPAGLAAAPFERKGIYPFRQIDLPITVLVPEWGLLRVAGIDFQNPDQPAVVIHSRQITPSPRKPANASEEPQQEVDRRSAPRRAEPEKGPDGDAVPGPQPK